MNLTQVVKDQIDNTPYFQLLNEWLNAPVGEPILQGDSGEYWRTRMQMLRHEPGGHERHIAASKALVG